VSVTTTSISLADGLKTVLERWDDTRAVWDDPISRDFEAGYVDPLKALVQSTIQAIDRLAPILARAQRECSDS
jgi:hypothetical protein